MKKEIAQAITHNLLTPRIIDTLNDYSDEEIITCHKLLETCHDIGTVREIQGRIIALRRLKEIRSIAIAVVGEAKNG